MDNEKRFKSSKGNKWFVIEVHGILCIEGTKLKDDSIYMRVQEVREELFKMNFFPHIHNTPYFLEWIELSVDEFQWLSEVFLDFSNSYDKKHAKSLLPAY